MKNSIGLMGLTLSSPNKGCMALAYSFLYLLKDIMGNEKYNVTAFISDYALVNDDEILNNVFIYNYSLKSMKGIHQLMKKMKQCDMIFDFTEGDSFSDIYGWKRMIKVSLGKIIAIKSGTSLVLGPQTYGPYSSWISKKLAGYAVKKSCYSCSRDEESSDLVAKIAGKRMDVYTDIAFGLSAKKIYIQKSKKIKIGINISALLWFGGYKGENQFNLKVDYQEYCLKIIKICKENRNYEIHLISHVYSNSMTEIENDYAVCEKIQKEHPECILSPMYFTPMEIKGYISRMDIFIGARMHATIASFSTMVTTIPFSYSKKFEGLYNSVGYPYVIHGLNMSTDEAINQTLFYINNLIILQRSQKNATIQIEDRLTKFKEKLKELLEI